WRRRSGGLSSRDGCCWGDRRMDMRRGLSAALAGMLGGWLVAAGALAAPPPLAPHDFTIRNFHFRSGETLPELKLRYYTLGQPRKDAAGRIVNAVLILHGTGGS